MRILLAEDEKRMAVALVALLKQEKYDVKVSTLTEILLAFSEESMEEILLLPILLSAGKEFSSILTITERFPDLPIKVLSPLLSTEDDLYFVYTYEYEDGAAERVEEVLDTLKIEGFDSVDTTVPGDGNYDEIGGSDSDS